MLPCLICLPILLQAAPPSTVGGPERARTMHLEEAVQRAAQNQPAILQARASTDAAEGRREQFRSGLLPQVIGSASYQRIHGAARGTTVGTGTTTPTTTT